VSDTKTPQGVVALVRRPQTGRERIEKAGGVPLVVVLHRANNPSNAGAVLRVAEAAGATGVVLTKGSTDPLSPKSLRGSMGSAFRLPLWTGPTLEEVLGWCAGRGIRTVTTAAAAPSLHTEIDWKTPRAVVLGPEAGGLTVEEVGAADDAVRIPMREPVESLNLATALAVVLYEAARQRNFA
ncbi:MAG TPA: RNA methyltransferase, partial [Pyrinomonadaceae bacterium]